MKFAISATISKINESAGANDVIIGATIAPKLFLRKRNEEARLSIDLAKSPPNALSY